MLIIKDIIKFLEDKFPPSLAYDWDNVGIQIGDINRKVKNIMITLDATTPVINEAVGQDVDLIIAHHPFIFSPLKSIDFTTPQGKNVEKLIKNDIAIYTMHTNYDLAFGGMNDVLAEKIGLQEIKPFAMIDDVHGLGRIGKLPVAQDIRSLGLDIEKSVSYANITTKIIIPWEKEGDLLETVAIIGGSGGKYIHEAKMAGADVLVTGDITHHVALEAQELGLHLVDMDHFSEVIIEEALSDLLEGTFNHIKVLTAPRIKPPS